MKGLTHIIIEVCATYVSIIQCTAEVNYKTFNVDTLGIVLIREVSTFQGYF